MPFLRCLIGYLNLAVRHQEAMPPVKSGSFKSQDQSSFVWGDIKLPKPRLCEEITITRVWSFQIRQPVRKLMAGEAFGEVTRAEAKATKSIINSLHLPSMKPWDVTQDPLIHHLTSIFWTGTHALLNHDRVGAVVFLRSHLCFSLPLHLNFLLM